MTYGGATVAYVTDHEPFWNAPGPGFRHPGDQRHFEFLRNADLVIHDAQYSEEEYRSKRGWGHSTVDYATDIAIAADVRKLALFHHDPTHDDETVEQLEKHSKARAAAAGSSLDVFAAYEGLELKIDGSSRKTTTLSDSALERRPVSGGRILIVTARPSDLATAEETLAEDGLVINAAANGNSAVQTATEVPPNLVIISSRLPDGDVAGFIQKIREVSANSELPVLILTDEQDSQDAFENTESVATDYLANPFSPPMLWTRVRAWLARTMNASDRKSTRLNSSHVSESRMPSSA